MCIPDPFIPKIGLGIKVTCKLCFKAIVLPVSFKVIILSAEVRASQYLKSISCWPGATSWCAASISNPNFSKATTISLLASSPKSTGKRSKYPPWSWVLVVALPSWSLKNRKNSTSGPKLVEYPISSTSFNILFKLFLGQPLKGEPSGL